MKKYGFIYITTNLITNRRYIGKRKYQFNNSDNTYLGSGKALLLAIDKYGSDNFKREILEECNSKKTLDEAEIKWISKFNASDEDEFYNIAKGGDGGAIYKEHPKGMLGKKHSEETLQVLREKFSGENNPFYGKTWTDETHPKGFKGRKHSEESKAKTSAKLKGRIESVETRAKKSKALKGRVFTEEHLKNMSLCRIGKNKGKDNYNSKKVSVIFPDSSVKIYHSISELLEGENISYTFYEKLIDTDMTYEAKGRSKNKHKHLNGIKIKTNIDNTEVTNEFNSSLAP